jgi:integrase
MYSENLPNFGYGNTMEYAARNALQIAFNDGHFSTVATDDKHFKRFTRFVRPLGIDDTRLITPAIYLLFGEDLHRRVQNRQLSVKKAQNILSSTNTTMTALRHDQVIWLSPKATVGSRCDVRKHAPAGLDGDKVEQAIQTLFARGHEREGWLIRCMYLSGMRRKETCLQNYQSRLNEAIEHGHINITEGSKGGICRYIDRWVPADDELIACLRVLAEFQGTHKSVIPTDIRYKEFADQFYCKWQRAAHPLGLGSLHDLRATRACLWYAELTGYPAPVVNRNIRAPKGVDKLARLIIAHRFGHARADVTNAYVGGQR